MRLISCRRTHCAVSAAAATVFSKGSDFAVAAPARRWLMTGRNGAGKSSLLRDDRRAGATRLAACWCLAGGDPELSIGEQAHYLGHQRRAEARAHGGGKSVVLDRLPGRRAEARGAALAAVGLDRLAGLPAAYLSAGQRRRLSIARLLAVKRPLWLLDEPTSALDAAAQVLLADLMREHLAGGGLIIAATHAPLGLDGARELRLERAA